MQERKQIKFEDVKHLTTEEYFKGNQFSIDAFNKKYKYGDESVVECIKRVCDYYASVEKTDELKKYWAERWFDEIVDQWWFPAGSVIGAAIPDRKISSANCVTIDLGKTSDKEWDSLEGIIRGAAYDVAKAAAARQGLGVDFSKLRPRGSSLLNSANESTGAVHWMRFIDSIAYYVGQCLHPNTKVLTENGWLNISNIVDDGAAEFVFSKNGKTKITRKLKNSETNIFKLKTEYGDEILASPEHKFFIATKNGIVEKELQNINRGDYIVGSIPDVEFSYVKINEFTYTINEYNNSNRLSIPPKYPEYISEELAYILGIIYGDGCHYNGHIEIAFSNSRPEILKRFDECMYICFGTHLNEYGLNVKPGGGACTVVHLGKYYTNFFQHINCLKGKAANLIYPKSISVSPKNVVLSFFNGLFDADGYNAKNKKNIQLAIIDKLFLCDLKRDLFRCGIVTKLSKKERHKFNDNWADVFILSCVGKKSYGILKECKFGQKIQIDKLIERDRLKSPFTAKLLKLPYHKFKDMNGSEYLSHEKCDKYCVPTNLYIQKIVDIESQENSITYDLTIDDSSHYFIAENILVSNCGRQPAFLFSLSCNHPDIEEFIEVKKDYTTIQNANISVQCLNSFYEAAEKDADWELVFEIKGEKIGDKIYIPDNVAFPTDKKDENGYYRIAKKNRPPEKITKTVKAKKLLELIAKNMWAHAEPGIQNIDIAKKYSNSDYVYDPNASYNTRIASTNACCVTGDTEILTDSGNKPIASLINKKINIWNGFEWSTVIPKIMGKNQPMLKIMTSSGKSLTCTLNHKWLIYNSCDRSGKRVESIDLNIGDELCEWFLPDSIFVTQNEKITSIEKAPDADMVYCFTEPLRHTGIFNGIMTGQSEQYLSPDSCCILASILASRFSVDKSLYDTELTKIAHSINRFLDNVNEAELVYKTYATDKQRIAVEQLRRTGAGVTDIVGWLMKCGVEYGAKDGNIKLSDFIKTYNYNLYKSSIEIGKEKGNFGAFNREKLEHSPFIQRMMSMGLEFTHLRNVTCSSIAPTGSLSLMFRNLVASYGIEPAFGIYFWKRTRISGKYEYYFCVPNIVRELFKNKGYDIPMDSDTIKDTWDGKFGKPIAEFIDKYKDEIGIKFRPAKQISVFEKLDLMAEVAKDIDSSISVTYELPENSKWEDVYDFIVLAHKKELKSIAAFPDKKMYGIISYIPFRELATKLISENVVIHEQNFTADEYEFLQKKNVVQTDEKINKNAAPKRPKKLNADVYHTNDYTIIVGLYGDDPYEVFAIKKIQASIKEGILAKISRGKYSLIVGGETNELNYSGDENLDALTRMISTALRHGADIKFIVHQLEKTEGSLKSASKSLARILKKYVADGAKVTGLKCPSCGNEELTRQQGCVTCSCGWSKC